MIKLIRHYDVDGNLVEDEEDERNRVTKVAKDRERLSVPLVMMDGRSDAPPHGQYYKRDGAGRAVGLCDIAAELRRVGAAEDYKQRLANAHKKLVPLRDAEVLTPPTIAKVKFTGQCPSCGYRAPREDAAPADDPRMVAYAAYKRRLVNANKHV